MISLDEAVATHAHSADKCLSSPASHIKNECCRCKLADQFPSSAENIKNQSNRLNLIRELKPSETPTIENIPSTNDAFVQVITEKKNALSKLTSSKENLHDKVVKYVRSPGYGSSHAYNSKKRALSSINDEQSPKTKQTKKDRSVELLTGRCETTPTWLGSSILDSAIDSWDARYEELVSYVKEFGNARVPQKFARNRALGRWVNKQRSDYRNFQAGIAACSLTGDKIQLLNKIGFEWNIRDSSWSKRYEELVSYVKEFGNARVPQKFAKNPALGRWVDHQRTKYKQFQNESTSCGIIAGQIQLLSSIGFEWNEHIINVGDAATLNCRVRKLPGETVSILKEWLFSPEHFSQPYPNTTERAVLLERTGINEKQLNNWFTNARQRILKKEVQEMNHIARLKMNLNATESSSPTIAGAATNGTDSAGIHSAHKFLAHSTLRNSSDNQYKDLASHARDFGDARVSQQFAESHRIDAILPRKEEISERTPNGETSCGKTKVIEFSC